MSATAPCSIVRLSEAEDIFNRLGIAASDFRIFSARHPRFLESCQTLIATLDAYFLEHPEQQHVLFVQRQGTAFFKRMPLGMVTPPSIKLARILAERRIEGLRLGPTANLTALTCAIEGLFHGESSPGEPFWKCANRRLDLYGLKGRVSYFADSELSGIEDLTLEAAPAMDGAAAASPLLRLPGLSVSLDLYRNTLASLHDVMTLVGAGGSPKLDPLLDAAARITTTIHPGGGNFVPLTAVKYSDAFTFNHSVNVCILVTAALKGIVTDEDRLRRVGQAALLHDLGKPLVPDSLLYQESVPSREERDEIERHPSLGAEILSDSAGVDPLAVLVAFDHHRRGDGSGYPQVRRKRPVDFVTSLIAAADIFEALTAERPYKRSLTAAEAFQVFLKLPEARGLETAARLLYNTLSPFPPGTFVELTTGEAAVVTRANSAAPHLPCVRLAAGSGERLVLSADELDLAAEARRRSDPLAVRRILPNVGASDADLHGPNADSVRREAMDERQREIEKRLGDGTLLASEG